MDLKQQIRALAERSRDASRALAKLDALKKNSLLYAMADGIEKSTARIQAANAKDIEAGKKAGLSPAMLDRLTLTDKRISEMAKGVREVAALPDPVGKTISEWTRPNGIRIQKVRVPIGVILIIYESRPNVTADAGCLCFKTGNAVILRGGSEAIHSNLAIADAMNVPGLPANSISVVPTTDRAAIDELLQLDELINLCIPRGGEGLIRAVAEKSRIPVIKHYKGVCHVYVDRDADFDMAEKIVVNAKCQRPGVCNAVETLLIDEKIADQFLPRIARSLAEKKVELRGDEQTRSLVSGVKPATEDDWYAEYLELILAVRVVNGVGEAIDHITKYGSAHSDAIVTANKATAEKFLREVDSSSVFWNASTRLADGGQYGFGAEIGISTDKLHARGPMGLEELTSYKFVVVGDGQLRE
ncbi:MAG TPA: glutamate-5-semialdehyde dehydrogenase [Verrucomicrobiae bacterium]|nr:glutamate-5-semialdehyde dehydrogenase [Verrucomicrobiae bacterium]